jgi:hypothetical protein
MNILQIPSTHVCKWKKKTLNYSRNGGKEGTKENDGEGELKYDIFSIL